MALLKLIQQNVAGAAAYTQYSVVIPRCNQFTLVLRDPTARLFWYTVTTNGTSPGSSSNLPQSPNTYNTIPAGASRTIGGQLGAQTIFFQSDKATQVLEVDYYADT